MFSGSTSEAVFSFSFQWFTFKFFPVHSSPQAGSRSSPVSREAKVDAFIEKWSDKDGSNCADHQLFPGKLCKSLGVLSPDHASSGPTESASTFERQVEFVGRRTKTGTWTAGEQNQGSKAKDPEINPESSDLIDCYKRAGFVFETKQGVERKKVPIRELDANDKSRQAAPPNPTRTGMYNLLDEFQSESSLPASQKKIPEQGIISVLKQIQDDMGATPFEGYGWPANLRKEEILTQLVTFDHERAGEERRGHTFWFRAKYQHPDAGTSQTEISVTAASKLATVQPWPKSLPEQIPAILSAVAISNGPINPATAARTSKRARERQSSKAFSRWDMRMRLMRCGIKRDNEKTFTRRL